MYDQDEVDMLKALKDLRGTVKYLKDQYSHPNQETKDLIAKIQDEIGMVESWLQINEDHRNA